MPNFEVTVNEKHRFLSKVKFSLKSAALSNSTDIQRRVNAKWDWEKKLYDDIAASSSSSSTDATRLKELRYVLHQIASQASGETSVSPKTSNMLIAILVNRISSFLTNAQRNEQLTEHRESYTSFNGGSFLSMDEFSCQSCCELLYNPITLQCGHSFCQICVLQNSLKTCVVCRKSYREIMKEYKINISLSKILQTWHSVEWFGRSLIVDGLQKLIKEEYQESVNMFSQALTMLPHSHIATLHRAKAYYLLNRLDQALEDSIKACILAQKWPETYYVKGEILFKLHCFEQSLLSLLICLVLDPHNSFAKDRIHEIVSKLVGSVYSDLTDLLNKNSGSEPSEKLSITNHKRRISMQETDTDSKRKKDGPTLTYSSTVTLDSVVTCSSSDDPASLTLTKSDTDVFPTPSEQGDPEEMRRLNTHVLLTFELSYDKRHDQILFGDGLGVFPSLTTELEKSLDSVLFEIDNSVTGDLKMLQNSKFDKENCMIKPARIWNKLLGEKLFPSIG